VSETAGMWSQVRGFLSKPVAPGGGDSSPIVNKGRARPVLCLHGLTGTPFEVGPVARAFAAKDHTVEAPLLAGHGGSAEALEASGWRDWLATARSAFDRVTHTGAESPQKAVVVGFSAGGLLALHIAAHEPERIAGLVIIAAPLRLRRFQSKSVRFLAKLPAALRRGPIRFLPKGVGADVGDPEVRSQVPSLPVMPTQCVASLLELGDTVRPLLPRITVPTLIAHGERDQVVPLEDSLELAGSLGSDVIKRLWLPRSAHLACVDVEKHTLIENVLGFCRDLRPEDPQVAG